jgi:TetR/AcrR family transcriptional regulator, cholesterol catabolism regulator
MTVQPCPLLASQAVAGAAEATRERIVDAAEACLREAGPGKVSLDRVASEAGVHRATIYRHFPGGRDQLLVAVVERVAKRFTTRLAEHVADQPTLSEAIVEALVYSVEETFRSRLIAPLFTAEEAGRFAAAGPASRALQAIVRDMWGPLLTEAKQRGEARKDLQLDELAELLLRLVFSLLSDWSPSTRDREETKAFLRQVITPFVTGGATARSRKARTAAPAEAEPKPTSSATQPEPDGRRVADRLLDSAAVLFRERGYARSTTRELAERLGISQPSLYHHVGSKQELLERLCVASLRRLREEASAIDPDSQAPLRELIRVHVDLVARDRDLHLARVFEQDALEPEAHQRVVAEHERYAALVRALISSQQDAGRIRSDIDSKHLGLALLNLLNWTIFWFDPSGAESPDQLARMFADVFLEGAAAPARASGSRRTRSPRRARAA